MTFTVGILAYGSLIDDPDAEIRAAIVGVVKDEVRTPFKVEYARKSSTRSDAPTLIPTKDGGARVRAQILVLNVSEIDATNMLYRRETRTHKDYVPPKTPSTNKVVIERLENFHGIDVVLYTSITANIDPLNSTALAELAINSANQRDDDEDGISYLINAKRNGIQTPLSDGYEEEIKRLTGKDTLCDARNSLRPAK